MLQQGEKEGAREWTEGGGIQGKRDRKKMGTEGRIE